jgi:hypothetical protein
MSLEVKLRKRVEQVLASPDERGIRGARLLDDARRVWRNVCHWVDDRHLVSPSQPDRAAMELAAHALQLPFRAREITCVGRYAQVNLRDRAEQSAEELVSELGDEITEPLLERTTELLQELPARTPAHDESKLLADVLNLDDFGVGGLFAQVALLTLLGQGVEQFTEAAAKREMYGYWEARLKDGFHFGPTRELAKRRLARARAVLASLNEELAEHGR